jgi:NTP pyrophosphatase (non-canonical NTP hydrolase)
MVANQVFQKVVNRFYGGIRPRGVDNRGRNSKHKLTRPELNPSIARRSPMAKYKSPNQNILVFPAAEPNGIGNGDWMVPYTEASPLAVATNRVPITPCEVVLSGSYRKGFETLKSTYEEFRDLGCTILSPSSVSIVREEDGFVYMQGEEAETPEKIELRHLEAIQRASFVWLHTPEGYVGPTAALEVGFARAAGVPVYARRAPIDTVLQSFVRLVDSPSAVLEAQPTHAEPPAPALRAFQEYYRRAAMLRGYSSEGPRDCLLLMVEEVGELARALRKREKLVRHGSYQGVSEAHELADVFLYVVHMANVLGFDLARIVQQKEFINVEKFLAR